MKRALFLWQSRFAHVGRYLVIALLVLTVLPKGSVPWPAVEILLVPFGLLLALTALRPAGNAWLERLRAAVFVFAAVLGLYVLLQTVPAGPLANPVWDVLRETLGNVAGAAGDTISVSPGQTLWALPRLLFPFTVFLVVLALFQDEPDALLLWRALAVVGALYAVYGLLQLLIFPHWLLFEPKVHYLDSLTGPLVNRNSASTLLGLSLVLSVGLLRHELSRLRRARASRPDGYAAPAPRLSRYGAVLIAAAALEFVALVMTKSRGGLLSTVLAAGVLVMLLDFRFLKAGWCNRILGTLAVLVLALLALDLFAGRTLYRMEVEGASISRLCAYRSTIEAAADNLPFGTGLATFTDVFPQYRDPSCGIAGVWTMAHNSYLENLLELGLPYLAFLAVGLVVVVRTLVYGLRERRRYRALPVAALAATVLVAAHAVVDFSLQMPAVSAFYAAMLASAMAVSLGRRRD